MDDILEEDAKHEAKAKFKEYTANVRKCILSSDEPTLHPGVRHVVEARERAESWGVTIHPKNLNTFEKDSEAEADPEETMAMTKKLSHLDGELRVLVEEALKEAKAKKDAEEEEMRTLVDEALAPTTSAEPTPSAGDAARAESNNAQGTTDEPTAGPCPELTEAEKGQKELDTLTSTYQQMCIDREEKEKQKKKGSKPAWALSEEAAADIELAEEEDLLSFVDNLDYDTYIKECDDRDLKEAWRLMQEAEAEEARGVDLKSKDEAWKAQFVRAMNNLAARDIQHGKGRGARVGRGPGSAASQRSVAESAAERAKVRIAELRSQQGSEAGDWDRSVKGSLISTYHAMCDDLEEANRVAKAEKLAAAQALLAEDPDMRAVHSTKSIAQLLETAKVNEAKAAKEGAKYTFCDCEPRPDYYQQPLIAVE